MINFVNFVHLDIHLLKIPLTNCEQNMNMKAKILIILSENNMQLKVEIKNKAQLKYLF